MLPRDSRTHQRGGESIRLAGMNCGAWILQPVSLMALAKPDTTSPPLPHMWKRSHVIKVNRRMKMKLNAMMFATVLSGALSTAAFAQAPQGGATGQTTTPAGQTATAPGADRNAETTITGCLEKNKSGGYWLTKAMPGAGAAGSGAVGTSGTTAAGRTGGSSTGMVYNLEEVDGKVGNADLDKHVGHKLEVTGRVDDTKSSDQPKSPSSPAASATDRETDAQDFHISSFKMISQSCS
jgi:hypothetical protein